MTTGLVFFWVDGLCVVLVWRFRAVRAVISGFVRLVGRLVLLLLRGGV